MENLQLYLFGPPRLEKNGHPVEMDTRKAFALLAVLALSGQVQSREKLVTFFYPEANPESARGAFRRTLSTLNRAIGPGVLSVQRKTVELESSAEIWVDILQFKNLLSEQPSISNLEQAINLFRNDFMAGFTLRDSPDFDDWQYQQSEELRRMLSDALDQLANLNSQAGNYEQAIDYAVRRVGLDPFLETGHRQLMLLYALAGQRTAALRQYRECVRILEQEFGVPPLEETTSLYQKILNGQVDKNEIQFVSGKTEVNIEAANKHMKVSKTTNQGCGILIGRTAETKALEEVLKLWPVNGMFISIEGEAGVGKTRLAEDFLKKALKAGHPIVQTRCFEGEAGLAYGPYIQALEMALEQSQFAARIDQLPGEIIAEAARLLPGLAVRRKHPLPSISIDGPGAQTRFFEGLRRFFIGLLDEEPTGILFIDDMQWADSASMDLISYLVHRLNESRFWILAVWRSQEEPNTDKLHQLVTGQKRSGHNLHLQLQRLNATEIASLARHEISDTLRLTLSSDFEKRLYSESEGIPFIALEYIHAWDADGENWKMPGSVRDLLHSRLKSPGEATRQLLGAAAVIGRPFDFNTLQAVSGRSEWEIVAGLEELLKLGLIREQGNNEYDFNHNKLKAVAYEEISTARRRLLHRRAAEAIISNGHSGRTDCTWTGLVANHFLLAGHPELAADYFRQAGEHARQLHANSEALAAFKSALDAGHTDRAGLQEASGDLNVLLGHYQEAITSYQNAAAFCSPTCLSNLMHKLGEVYHRRGEWQAAEGHFRAALDSAGDDSSPAWLTHLFTDWSLTAYRSGQLEKAHDLANQAKQKAESADYPGARAQALNMLGILARDAGKLEDAGRYFKESLNSADLLDDAVMRTAALNNLARLQSERGLISEAIPLARQAKELCARMGDRHRLAALQNNLADIFHAAGMEEESMEELKKAVSLFAEIGENEGTRQPEIWKLTEW